MTIPMRNIIKIFWPFGFESIISGIFRPARQSGVIKPRNLLNCFFKLILLLIYLGW